VADSIIVRVSSTPDAAQVETFRIFFGAGSTSGRLMRMRWQ
jgi:hypothetical protein